MGCGKSTVATALSQKYSLEHIDTDKFIEEKYKTTISDIFEKYGEQYFRDLEHKVICELLENSDCVLSLGGGAVMYERNVTALKKCGYTIVFINTDFDVIKKRLENDSTRPLLKTDDINLLYKKRYDIYKDACDFEINCRYEDAVEIADKIITSII